MLTQIARTHSLQYQFDEAHSILAEVADLLPKVNTSTHIRYLLEKGRCHNSNKEKAAAMTLFEEAWTMGQGSNADFHLIDAAHMLGIAAPQDQQLGWNLKALAIAEKTTDPRAEKWKGSLYNNIGWTYFAQEEYEKALAIFEQTYQWYVEQDHERFRQIAKWSIAKTYRLLNRIEEALKLLWELDAEYKANKIEEPGYNQEELGECYWAKGAQKTAAEHFKQAYALLSKDTWLVKNEAQRLESLKQRAGL